MYFDLLDKDGVFVVLYVCMCMFDCQRGLGRVIGVVGVCYAHSYLSQHSPQKQT